MIRKQKEQTFREKVYVLARQIPKGKVATYGQLAHMVGSSHAARAVGMCMSQNTDSKDVPCHRVVSSDGRLKGYKFGNGIQTKRQLLLQEGVRFIGDRVDFSESLWRPHSA